MSGYIGPLPVPQGIQNKETFTATAGQTTFNTNGYTDGAFINVYLNGVRLINGTDYTATNGSDIVLTQAASVSDVLDFETFNEFSLASQQFENITLKNPTHEDTDGGRESAVSFKGEQSGGEISTLAQIQASHDGTADDQKGDLIFKVNDGSDNDAPTEAMRIDSAGNVGIGTADPHDAGANFHMLTLNGPKGGGIVFSDDDVNQHMINTTDDNSLRFTRGSGLSDETMRIDSSGNIGIGTSSPRGKLEVFDTNVSGVFDAGNLSTWRVMQVRNNIESNTGTAAGIALGGDGTSDTETAGIVGISDNSTGGVCQLAFITSSGNNSAERMRIASDGVVLVGRTAEGDSNAGVTLRPDGFTQFTRDGSLCGDMNRLSSDGDILRFQKAGTPVGTIGSYLGAYLYIGSTGGGTDTHINFVNGNVRPATATGGHLDNTLDLGHSSSRWDDVFATNGTIQTSDENEKQNIASLTSAEITAATAISKLFKTYKWKDKVTEKGDNARTHTGVIAQQVETAMSDAGLDASKYAFWCSDTWWQVDDGEAYDTQEEAPEGATERNRKGIRYPELLSFIGAATEQRLTSIEARLDALEAE